MYTEVTAIALRQAGRVVPVTLVFATRLKSIMSFVFDVSFIGGRVSCSPFDRMKALIVDDLSCLTFNVNGHGLGGDR